MAKESPPSNIIGVLAGLGLGLGLSYIVNRRKEIQRELDGRESDTLEKDATSGPVDGEYKGRVVIVTGGANGIGSGVTRAFHSAGAHVWVADVDDVAGRRMEKELGSRLHYRTCDASIESDIISFCEEVKAAHNNCIDCLVNNVGVQLDDGMPVHKLSSKIWEKVLAINLTSYFLFSRCCLPELIKSAKYVDRCSCIINMASVQGLQSQKGIPAYAASKGGICSLTRQMSMDYASKGVRVCAIAPGTIRTALVENLLCGRHGKEYLPKALQNVGAAYPIGRIGEIHEIAQTALFLASDAASFITGECVTVDGGIMAKGGWAGAA